ncbi:MAG: hypothetical protein KGL39_32045 [Patescibacteria group bacterium]|nr:hypothetical protein [Patescibacteria group bacterium]
MSKHVVGPGLKVHSDTQFRRHLLNVVELERMGKGNGMVALRAREMLKIWDELVALRARVASLEPDAPMSSVSMSKLQPSLPLPEPENG